jgi:acyl-[acyl-carrier-protein]-phospholipid O-acyltransferase / long-chain-fatty-acid--[acyl-carrier-protein] ligase
MKPIALRLFLWLVTRIIYRVSSLRPDNVPSQGGALLVSNHVSFVDMLLILASTKRFVRFLIPEEVCQVWWLKPWMKWLRVIPLPEHKRELAAALRQAGEAIRKGEVIGVFPEKNISRIGILLPFRHEFEQIMQGVDAPVIPVCLDGVWGSIFSYQAGRFFWKIPRHLPYPVTVSFGEPMPAVVTAPQVRQAIRALNAEAWAHRRLIMKPLGRAFVQQARHHPFRFAMADALVPKLSFGGALAGTVFLARRLRPHWKGQEMVGIFLPPSIGGALVNFAALLAGKVPVNLNYTLSEEVLASCARQCNLQSVVTVKAFLDRVKITPPGQLVLLEELRAKPRLSEKLAALFLSWLAPIAWLERAVGSERRPQLDDLATIVFSSGSTGEPKGVKLSHYNVASNVAQIGQTFDFDARHRFLGILPFFHSFGFTATLMEPALSGFGVVFHYNPLEGKAIGELVRRYGVTTLMATPRFLDIYLRTCEPADFGSLTFVMAGAEKLPATLANEFQTKFRLLPVEGYGCTECSPVVAANTYDFRAARIFQVGSRPGTIGPPLPGVSVRFIHPETREPVPDGTPGLLLVRGPNVMQGYLGRDDKTAMVLRDGWYNTGDVAVLDEDGFLRITGRISRFSKIGGEMVPHEKVEEELQKLTVATEASLAVTGVTGDTGSERLVVLHKLAEPELTALLNSLPRLNLPNLWIPKRNQFFRVEDIPVLGTGKLDLAGLKRMAERMSREGRAEASVPEPP